MFSLSLLALGGLASVVSATPKACSLTTLSCQNTTAVADLCCFNAPGGQLLLTQFWDTEPVTGPTNSWTLHGLWPDKCDGTYEQYCDSSREYSDIRGTLVSAGEDDLLDYMNTYWKDYQGDDETFWEHEWNKHGTCISTLKPSCYSSYTAREELIDYLHTTVDLFKTRNTYSILSAAGITPSSSKTYTASAIKAALQSAHGQAVTIGCKSGVFNEVWYHYNVRGSVQTGEFVAAAPDGTKDTCSGSVSYRPKTSGSTPTTTAAAPTGTSTGIPSGSGTLSVVTSGASKGCLISGGTWYVGGTCASYTAAASGSGFTLTSSKGKCGVTSGKFVCSSSTTAAVFTIVNGKLAYNGANTWYGSAVPSGTTQIDLYTTTASGRTVSLQVNWVKA